MMDSSDFARTISLVEPTFILKGAWTGRFRLSGRTARISMEEENWLVASLPVKGSPTEILRRQGELGSVKATTGPRLQTEMPLDKSTAATFQGLRSALGRALTRLDGVQDGNVPEPADGLAECLGESEMEWVRDASGYRIHLDSDGAVARVFSRRFDVLLSVPLARFRNSEGAPLEALSHFMLALNSRLRFVRGSLMSDGAALEVSVPTGLLEPEVIRRASNALVVGMRLARRECRALLNPLVADSYRRFHQKEKKP